MANFLSTAKQPPPPNKGQVITKTISGKLQVNFDKILLNSKTEN